MKDNLLWCGGKYYNFIFYLRSGKNTQKNYTKKDLHNTDNPDCVITHLKPDILEGYVKWALGSITTNKASGGEMEFQLSYFKS